MNKNKILRSGVIPYYIDSEGEIHMYFMKPSDPKFGGPDFQLAKGRIDEGEDAERTALREGEEELGLKLENIRYHQFVGNHYFNETHTVYIAKIKNKDDFNEPCYETGETIWMTPDQFEVDGRALHRELVRDAVDLIKLMEQLPQ